MGVGVWISCDHLLFQPEMPGKTVSSIVHCALLLGSGVEIVSPEVFSKSGAQLIEENGTELQLPSGTV